MLLQLLNIAMGLVAALPGLRERGLIKEDFEEKTAPWRAGLGMAGLVSGLLGLLIRAGLLPLPLSFLGESYPQAIPAILLGLLLAAPHLAGQALLKKASEGLQPYAFWLGVLGIACGLGSLLFGCVLPVVCGVPF